MTSDLDVSAEDLMRDATKRIRRMLPAVSVYSLTPEQVETLVAGAFERSRELLQNVDAS